jgi:hypothetical protein
MAMYFSIKENYFMDWNFVPDSNQVGTDFRQIVYCYSSSSFSSSSSVKWVCQYLQRRFLSGLIFHPRYISGRIFSFFFFFFFIFGLFSTVTPNTIWHRKYSEILVVIRTQLEDLIWSVSSTVRGPPPKTAQDIIRKGGILPSLYMPWNNSPAWKKSEFSL